MRPKDEAGTGPISKASDVRRSDGPISATEARSLRKSGIPLAYDPVQIGWVRAGCIDDIDMVFKPTRGPRYAKLTPKVGTSYALRSWRTSDLDRYHAMLDDAAVWKHMMEGYPAPLTRSHAAALIELSNTSNHHEVYALLHKGTPIGQVRLHFGEDDGAELSYWLGRSHWGKGHGSAMVPLFVKRSFADHPSLTSIRARTKPQNEASRRILVSSGFTEDSQAGDPNWLWFRVDRADIT